MSNAPFQGIDSIKFESRNSENPLAFRYYDKKKVVAGKTTEQHLRRAVCYWHSFAGLGHDILGLGTFEHPWCWPTDALHATDLRFVAFEFFEKFGAQSFAFRYVARDSTTIGGNHADLDRIAKRTRAQRDKVSSLW